VHDRAVGRLGPEDPIGPGALHRAGQPCATCHAASGPAESDFSVAGTIFASPGGLVGVEGARVELVDATGASPPAASPVVTNCVGNFWVKRATWDPVFPIRVTVTKGNTRREMKSDIGHSASCTDCHAIGANPLVKAGPVTMFPSGDPEGPPTGCAVDPDRSKL
jgi:hypothetical protein